MVPAALRSVIERCLARNPDERFQRAADVGAALRQEQPVTFRAPRSRVRRRALAGVFAAAALIVFTFLAFRANRPAGGTSLAVLRFRVLSASPEFAFLGIGVPDTITSRLAVVNGMRVRAHFTSQKDAGEPQAVGRELGVDYVLTGTIQQGQDDIRITPQLVRVADGVSVWSHAYTRRSIDLLALQDEIARGLAAALPLDLTAEDRARMDRQYTRNPDAHALYVRGRAELVRNDSTATLAAIEAFEAALARDQDYVLAYAGLAVASAKMRLFFALEPDVATWQARAHQAAQRALQLNPDVAETREALAAVYRSTEFNWAGTLDESARALRYNPNLDLPHLYRASAFAHLGLFDRAESEARAAQENNPANIDEPLRVRGVSAMFAGRFDEAVTLLEQARRASGTATEWNLAYAYYYVGRKAEAEAMLRTLTGSARSQRRAQATLASFLAARGEAGWTHQSRADAILSGTPRRLCARRRPRTTGHAGRGAAMVARGAYDRIRMLSLVRAGSALVTAQVVCGLPPVPRRVQAVVGNDKSPVSLTSSRSRQNLGDLRSDPAEWRRQFTTVRIGVLEIGSQGRLCSEADRNDRAFSFGMRIHFAHPPTQRRELRICCRMSQSCLSDATARQHDRTSPSDSATSKSDRSR
jgi:TolB-like protein